MSWVTYVLWGAIFGGLSVTAGAFGAHLLRAYLTPEQLATFELGARYQMYHALALFGVALVASHFDNVAVRIAGLCFLVGTVLFSGSLYGLGMGLQRWLAFVTPVGGSILIVGWLALVVSLIQR